MSRLLPPGWSWLPLERFAADEPNAITDGPFGSNLKSSDYVENGEVRVIRLGNIGVGRFVEQDKSFVTAAKFSRLAKHEARAGDLVLAALAEPVGRCSEVPEGLGTAMVKADCVRVRVNSVFDRRYLMHALNSPGGRARAEAAAHGMGRLRINLSDLRSLVVPTAPPDEQRRIVAKLEALQGRSRRAREALDAVPPLLEKLRQSILAAAFRGDLTKDWRAKHPDVEPASTWIRNNPQPEQRRSGRAAAITVRPGRCAISVGDPKTSTPPGWCWTSLLSVARMESGHTPSRAVTSYWNGGIPWVSIPDARDHNGTTIDETASTISEEGLANSAARILPRGTVCLVRTAASIGYVTVLGREMATSQDFANWVCGPALLPKYLMYALWAERDAIRSFGEGSAHPTVYFPELKAFHLKLAPLEEQQVIVDRIERYLSTWERLRGSVSAARQAQATLESSYLAKAFRGELVPQDPRDEPAEAMLARLERGKGAGQETAGRAKSSPGRRRAARG